MQAALITIGDEILSGNTVDTNSNFIATELRRIGIRVVQIFTVSDDIPSIQNALAAAADLADLIIATGGLGPTKDDRTKLAFSGFFKRSLVFDEITFAHLRGILERRNRSHLLEINRPQAEILEGATVFQNENGTAPCQMISRGSKLFFSLPGVPFEVKPLIKNQIIPYLTQTYHRENITVRTISIVDFPESALAQHIESWEAALPKNISLSYLPIGNRIKLRLTATGRDLEQLNKILDEEIIKLKPLISDKVISWHGDEIQEILAGILTEKNLSLAVAESCTGGEIQRKICSVPGCSAYFQGGVTAYAEKQKTDILKVPARLMENYTTVSAEVAEAMAAGCRQLFGTDISLAVTGAAGPATDAYQTAVGTVFYTINIGGNHFTQKLFLPHLERQDFMNFVAQRILQDLVMHLSGSASS